MYESDGVLLPEPKSQTEMTANAISLWMQSFEVGAKSLLNSVVHGATGLDLTQELTGSVVIEFPNVQSIEYEYARDVAQQLGTVAYALIPWYLKPIQVVITGLTYVGAYSTTDAESFIYDIKTEQRRLDTLLSPRSNISRTALSKDSKAAISRFIVGGDSELDKLELYGVLQGVKFTESVDNGALVSYRATYIGVDSESYRTRIAKLKAQG